jgi:uncharacterized protein
MNSRLAPTMTQDTAFFWEGLKSERLLVQRCDGCTTLRHPPRPMCPQCQSLKWSTIEATGRGTVISYVIPRHPPMPFFDDGYIVALVELEEGVRLVTNLVEVTPDEVSMGMRVVVRFERFDNDVVLALFAPEHIS